jgi:DnaJ-domain-containing protein 1
MKSQMLNRRRKQATVLVSRQTLEQAISEGQALAEKLLQTNPNDPSLDQIEQAVARLQGVLQSPNVEDQLDDAKQPGIAAEVKKDVDMIASKRQQARGGLGAGAEVVEAPIEAGAGSSDPAWTTDRDDQGKPKDPLRVEVPRIPLTGAKKKQAEPPVDAAAPAAGAVPAPAPAGNVLDFIPTEDLLKIISNMPKDEDFAQNKAKQDGLKQLIDILKARPVVQVPQEAAPAPAPPANAIPVAASKNAKGEPFGGKQAPPFGSKEKDEKKESSAKTADDPNAMAGGVQHGPESAAAFVSEIPQAQGGVKQTKEAEVGKRHDDVPIVAGNEPGAQGKDQPKEASGGESRKDERKDDVPFIGKNAVAPPGWERQVKEMKKDPDIDNPFALAWSMKDKGYTPHKASFIYRKRGAKYLVEKGDILEDGGRTPEVAQARKLKDEGPAKLERPATTDMAKLASAVKDAESVGEKLKAMYLDAKPLLNENSTAPVRNFVESIYKAYSLCDDAVKTLNKQEMQEKAEEEAAEIKKNNKKSSLLGLSFAAAE